MDVDASQEFLAAPDGVPLGETAVWSPFIQQELRRLVTEGVVVPSTGFEMSRARVIQLLLDRCDPLQAAYRATGAHEHARQFGCSNDAIGRLTSKESMADALRTTVGHDVRKAVAFRVKLGVDGAGEDQARLGSNGTGGGSATTSFTPKCALQVPPLLPSTEPEPALRNGAKRPTLPLVRTSDDSPHPATKVGGGDAPVGCSSGSASEHTAHVQRLTEQLASALMATARESGVGAAAELAEQCIEQIGGAVASLGPLPRGSKQREDPSGPPAILLLHGPSGAEEHDGSDDGDAGGDFGAGDGFDSSANDGDRKQHADDPYYVDELDDLPEEKPLPKPTTLAKALMPPCHHLGGTDGEKKQIEDAGFRAGTPVACRWNAYDVDPRSPERQWDGVIVFVGHAGAAVQYNDTTSNIAQPLDRLAVSARSKPRAAIALDGEFNPQRGNESFTLNKLYYASFNRLRSNGLLLMWRARALDAAISVTPMTVESARSPVTNGKDKLDTWPLVGMPAVPGCPVQSGAAQLWDGSWPSADELRIKYGDAFGAAEHLLTCCVTDSTWLTSLLEGGSAMQEAKSLICQGLLPTLVEFAMARCINEPWRKAVIEAGDACDPLLLVDALLGRCSDAEQPRPRQMTLQEQQILRFISFLHSLIETLDLSRKKKSVHVHTLDTLPLMLARRSDGTVREHLPASGILSLSLADRAATLASTHGLSGMSSEAALKTISDRDFTYFARTALFLENDAEVAYDTSSWLRLLAVAAATKPHHAGAYEVESGLMTGTFVHAEGWLRRLRGKFCATPARPLANCDLLTCLVKGKDLINKMAHALGLSEAAFWQKFRCGLRCRMQSMPGGPRFVLLLNVWPCEASNCEVAAGFGLPPPADASHDWAYGLPQLATGSNRTGFSPLSGLVKNAGYQGDAVRLGLINTLHRTVLVPRGDVEPLLVLAATNQGEGMNLGSPHAPSMAVLRGATHEATQANFEKVVFDDAKWLYDRWARNVHGPVQAGEDETLQPVSEQMRDFYREGTLRDTSDSARVRHMEAAAGCALLARRNIDEPYPRELFD